MSDNLLRQSYLCDDYPQKVLPTIADFTRTFFAAYRSSIAPEQVSLFMLQYAMPVMKYNKCVKDHRDCCRALQSAGYSLSYFDTDGLAGFTWAVSKGESFLGTLHVLDEGDHDSVLFNGHSSLLPLLDTITAYTTNTVQCAFLMRKNGQGVVADRSQEMATLPQVYPCCYPGLPMPSELASTWKESAAKCLLLYGPAGTGKSIFVGHLLNEMQRENRYLITSQYVLEHPSFLNYLDVLPDGSIVVLEDADVFLSKRTEGNKAMSSLLNLLCGIAQRNLRFVFLTNLPTLRDIDPALLRSARLYAALEFLPLQPEHAAEVREKIGLPYVEFTKPVTISDALHPGEGYKPANFGFTV